jgi:hypothetical protein
MSSREMVIELVAKLPENMPLAEIAREIELLAGIQTAREQARRNEGVSAEEARKLVDSSGQLKPFPFTHIQATMALSQQSL